MLQTGWTRSCLEGGRPGLSSKKVNPALHVKDLFPAQRQCVCVAPDWCRAAGPIVQPWMALRRHSPPLLSPPLRPPRLPWYIAGVLPHCLTSLISFPARGRAQLWCWKYHLAKRYWNNKHCLLVAFSCLSGVREDDHTVQLGKQLMKEI